MPLLTITILRKIHFIVIFVVLLVMILHKSTLRNEILIILVFDIRKKFSETENFKIQ